MTKVKLFIGSDVTMATLNDSVSAKSMIAKLPYTVSVSRAHVDYCGLLPEPLESVDSEAGRGWKNGEISYIPGADWIAFFFGGEEESASDSNPQHIIGRVDDPSAVGAWPKGSVKVRIEAA